MDWLHDPSLISAPLKLFRFSLAMLVIAVARFAVAQDTISVDVVFDGPGERQLWIGPWPPGAVPSEAIVSKESVAKGQLATGSPSDPLIILDVATGNLAKLDRTKISSKPLRVTEAEFKSIYRMGVRLEHAGKGAASGTITLTAGKEERSQLLTSNDNGTVWFTGIPIGQVRVKVKYRVGDVLKEAPVSIFEMTKSRSEAEPVATIAVADPIETVGSAPNQTATEQKSNAESPPSSIGRTILYFIAILIAIGVAYGILRYVQKNQSQVERQLEKLGVNIPQPGDADDSAIPVAMPQRPEPAPQIILGDSIDPPPSDAPASTTAIKSPRLTKVSVERFEIAEGETTVGRDAACALSLSGEETASRRHASLVRSGDVVTVEDLGSTNGTYVNGAKTSYATTLKNGDTVQFGSVQFRYEE